MSRDILDIGSAPDTGSGEELRSAMTKINLMTSELYEIRNRLYDLNSFVVSDADDLYAHDSQILIQRLTDKTVLLVLYTCDKVTKNEGALTTRNHLKVYELTTKTLLKTIELFYPGLEAGLTLPANKLCGEPRMYVSGTTLRCFSGCASTGLFNRDIDISNSDPATWTAGNLVIEQMTMKDAGGNNVTVDVTPANIQTHLEYSLGDTNIGYNNLTPWFRNLDRITIDVSGNWYSILEAHDELGAGLSNIAILVKSIDNGASWSFCSLVGYTTLTRVKVIESSVVLIGTVFHVINRTTSNSINHYSSVDGVTWINKGILSLSTLESKPTAINYYKNNDIDIGVLIAMSLTSEIIGNTNRTTLGIFETDDFNSFTEVAKIITGSFVHYPSLCHFSHGLYLSYTKGMKVNTDGAGATYNNRNTVVVTKIY